MGMKAHSQGIPSLYRQFRWPFAVVASPKGSVVREWHLGEGCGRRRHHFPDRADPPSITDDDDILGSPVDFEADHQTTRRLATRRHCLSNHQHIGARFRRREVGLVASARRRGLAVGLVDQSQRALLLREVSAPSAPVVNVPLTTTTQWSRPSLSTTTVSPAPIPVVFDTICIVWTSRAQLSFTEPPLMRLTPLECDSRYVPRWTRRPFFRSVMLAWPLRSTTSAVPSRTIAAR